MFTYLFNPDKGESFILSCLLQIWACLERGFLIHIPVAFLRESRILNFSRKEQRKGEGGGTPLYNPNRYVPPQRLLFLCRFGLIRVQILLILVQNRVWFLRKLRKWMNVFIVSIPNSPGELLSSLFECWFLLQSTTINPGYQWFFSLMQLDASVSAQGRSHERRSQ